MGKVKELEIELQDEQGLTIKNIEYTLPKINFDLKDLTEQVNTLELKYKDLILKEEDVPNIKKEMAQLNKLSKAVNDQKISITKAIKSPITEFENAVKELVTKIDTTYRGLKDQTDNFAEKQKEAKRQEILALSEWVEQYMVFDEEWLKPTYSIAKVKTVLEAQKQAFQNHSLLIETTCKAVGLEPNKYYLMLANHDEITSIIDMINNDNQVKNQYQTREVESNVPAEEVHIAVEDIQDQDIYEFTLKIKGTRLQLKALREYIDNNKLTYEKV